MFIGTGIAPVAGAGVYIIYCTTIVKDSPIIVKCGLWNLAYHSFSKPR